MDTLINDICSIIIVVYYCFLHSYLINTIHVHHYIFNHTRFDRQFFYKQTIDPIYGNYTIYIQCIHYIGPECLVNDLQG